MKRLSEKRIKIGNAINAELLEMTERLLNLLGNIDSSNIDAFEDHFMKNQVIKDNGFGKRIVREHIVEYILDEFGTIAFGTKPVLEQNESKYSKGSTSRRKN